MDLRGSYDEWEKRVKKWAKRHDYELSNKQIKSKVLEVIKQSKDHNFWEKINSNNLRSTGVFCLTEDSNNILMFSHYSKNHKGFCIGFSTAPQYTNFYYRVPIKITNKINYVYRYTPLKYLDSPNEEFIKLAIFTKSKDWEYECEWRVFDLNNQGLIPFEKTMIKEIIIGCQTENNFRNDLIKTTEIYYPNARIYDAKRVWGSLSLEKVQVN
jgi:hypothetical protein